MSLQALPVGDPATYALLRSGRTTAIFQLESRGMRDLIRRLKPDCFDDIVALVALFRPGPLSRAWWMTSSPANANPWAA